MALCVRQDEATRPADIGPLGSYAVVLGAAADAHLVEQARRLRCNGPRSVDHGADYRLTFAPVCHTASSVRYFQEALPREAGAASGQVDDFRWDFPDGNASVGLQCNLLHSAFGIYLVLGVMSKVSGHLVVETSPAGD